MKDKLMSRLKLANKKCKLFYAKNSSIIHFAVIMIFLVGNIGLNVAAKKEARDYDMRDEERTKGILCVLLLPPNSKENPDSRSEQKAGECVRFNSSRPDNGKEFKVTPPEHQNNSEVYYIRYKDGSKYDLMKSSNNYQNPLEPVEVEPPKKNPIINAPVPTNSAPKKYVEDCVDGILRIKYEDRISWQSTGQLCEE